MKTGVVLFAVFMIICVDLSTQLNKYINCSTEYVREHANDRGCAAFTCHGPGRISGVLCPLIDACMNQLGYVVPDDTKPYPECCGGPICP